MVNESCFNCGNPVNNNYCGFCGQKKYTRIDKKYILSELENTILQTNKGFLFSIKKIVINPGGTARKFIGGSRINHYKPILLAFLLSGISAFISFKIIGLKEITEEFYSKQQMISEFMIDYLSFTSSYNSIIFLSLIPFLAIVTKIALRKWGDNYYEHIVMNAYILSLYLIINIVILYPLMYFLKGNADFIVQLSSLSILTVPLIMIWFFKGYYLEKSLKSIVGRVLLMILNIIIGFLFLMIASIILGFIFAMIMGPEALDALEYYKPK
jgi:hypothetical protein